jgi:hypothetical protein
MNILLLKEHEDGSATYSFDITIEERELLINFAIITAIKSGITEGSKYVGNIDLGNPECGTSDSVHGEGEQPRESEQS